MESPENQFSKNPDPKRHLTYLLVIPPSILIILVVVFLDNVVHAFRMADYSDLLIAFGLFVVAAFLISLKFWLLLDKKIAFSQMLRADGLSYFINQFVPIPSEALRVTGLSLIMDMESGWASARMLLDFLLNFLMRIIAGFAILMIPAPHKPHIKILSSVIIFIILTAVLVWFYNNPDKVRVLARKVLFRVPFLKKEWSERYARTLSEALEIANLKQILVAWLLSLAIWIIFTAFFYEGLAIFNIDLPTGEALTIALLTLILAPPSTPVMIVFQQILVSAGLMALQIIPAESVIVYSFLNQGIQVVYWLLPALWAILTTNATLTRLVVSSRKYWQDLNQKTLRKEGDDQEFSV